MGVLFNVVRNGVSALEAAQAYGLAFGRNNRARCPWHDDKHPDLAFYDGGKRCYCHACHAGGDSIALTAQLFGLSPLEAARKLNADFHLGADEREYAPPSGASKAEQRRALREWWNHRFSELCEVERQALKCLPRLPGGWDNPAFRRTLRALALVQDELEMLHALPPEGLAAMMGGEPNRDRGRISV